MLSPTYKQRNEDFRKLFKQLPDTERLIVGTFTEASESLQNSNNRTSGVDEFLHDFANV